MGTKLKILVVLALWTSSISAQALLSFQIEDSNYLDAHFGFELGSKGLENEFILNFWKGENLNEHKVAALDRLRSKNQLGSLLTGGVAVGLHTNNPLLNKYNLDLLISAGHLNIQSVNYSKDAFKLMFFGNNYDDQTDFNLSNERFYSYGQDKIGFGVLNRTKNFGLTVNAVGITNYSELQLSSGFVSTKDDQIFVEMEGSGSRSYGSTYYKGMGVAIDLQYSIPLLIRENLSSIRIDVSNIGIGFLNRNLISNAIDTSFVYGGLTFKEILDYDENGFRLDDEIGLQTDSSAQAAIMLPMFIEVAKTVNPNAQTKFQSFFGIRQYTNWNAFPLVFGGMIYALNNHFFVGLNSSIGNFSTVRVGMNMGFKAKKWNLLVGADDLTSVGPKGNGATLNLRTQWKF